MAVPLVTAPAAFKPSFIIPPEIAKYPLKLDNAIVFQHFYQLLLLLLFHYYLLYIHSLAFKAPFSK